MALSRAACDTPWRTARAVRVSPARTVSVAVVTVAGAAALAVALAACAGTLTRCPGWMYAVGVILLSEYSVERLTL